MKNLTKKFLALAVVTTALFNAPQVSAQITQGAGGTLGANSPTTNTNVGIGTTAPANRLHIVAPTATAPQLRLSDATGSWQLWGSGNFRIRDGANNDRL